MDYAAARMGHGQIPVRRPIRRALHIRHGLIGSAAPPRTKFRIVPGTANLFMAFEPLGRWRKVAVTDRRRREDGARFVRDLVDGRHRKADKLVRVMDQRNTHSPASLCEAFAPEAAKRLADRLAIHHTPKHGLWLNMAEIELS